MRFLLFLSFFIGTASAIGADDGMDFYPPSMERDECSFHMREDAINDPDFVEIVVEYRRGEQQIGTISYMKLPMLDRYIIFSLYVEPQYRKKGYGSALLTYACDRLRTIGAQCVYLQPGPFEIGKDSKENFLTTIKPVGDAQLDELKNLKIFYEKNGFVLAPQWLIPFVRLAYELIQIDEDAAYLMVKTLI